MKAQGWGKHRVCEGDTTANIVSRIERIWPLKTGNTFVGLCRHTEISASTANKHKQTTANQMTLHPHQRVCCCCRHPRHNRLRPVAAKLPPRVFGLTVSAGTQAARGQRHDLYMCVAADLCLCLCGGG